MTLKLYSAVLKHDHGTVRLTLIASSDDEARRIIMLNELCPERAIESLKEIKIL